VKKIQNVLYNNALWVWNLVDTNLTFLMRYNPIEITFMRINFWKVYSSFLPNVYSGLMFSMYIYIYISTYVNICCHILD